LKDLTAASFVCLLLLPASPGAGKKDAPAAELPSEHTNASKTLTFRTPTGWAVHAGTGQPETTEARGDGLIVRIVRREGELGLDSMHVECMLVRLAGAMDTFPQVDYEYDFVGGAVGERKALDSAFVVHYDEPIEGHRDWRQRNLTVVGGGESVCIVAYAPLPVWKKSKPARNLLTAIVESVRF
jgi:hypothetical protein